jgi:hypothetical protein
MVCSLAEEEGDPSAGELLSMGAPQLFHIPYLDPASATERRVAVMHWSCYDRMVRHVVVIMTRLLPQATRLLLG